MYKHASACLSELLLVSVVVLLGEVVGNTLTVVSRSSDILPMRSSLSGLQRREYEEEIQTRETGKSERNENLILTAETKLKPHEIADWLTPRTNLRAQ